MKLYNRFQNWWFRVVTRYYRYLACKEVSRLIDIKASGYSREDIAAIATLASDKICADSGMCASKSWSYRPGSNKAPELLAKFESTTRERHDAVTTMLRDLTGKPVPPPIEGVKPILEISTIKTGDA